MAVSLTYLRIFGFPQFEGKSRNYDLVQLDTQVGNWGVTRAWQFAQLELIKAAQDSRSAQAPQVTTREWLTRLSALSALLKKPTGEPEVTIVIPAFDCFGEVAACIESILTWGSTRQFSILVSDDASVQCRFDALAALRDVEVRRNAINLGYIANVNAAVRECQSEYILTLNSDVIVAPGWLDALMDAMDQSDKIVIVGPRILGSDLSLNEAGGVIFSDGSAAHRGRGAQADDSRFNFTADVDFVSGCAMLVRSSFWTQQSGLDEYLSPAYFDDVDLCLRARAEGYRVLYAPLASVVHLEGTSMGRDPSDVTSLKRYQVINQSKLMDKHHETLKNRPQCSDFTDLADLHRQDELTFLVDRVPTDTSDGGSSNLYRILDYTVELGYRTKVVSMQWIPTTQLDSAHWRSQGIEVTSLFSERGVDLLNSTGHLISYGLEPGLEALKRGLSPSRWTHFTVDVAARRLAAWYATTDESESAERPLTWYHGITANAEELWLLERKILESASCAVFVTPEDLEWVRQNGGVGDFVIQPTLHKAYHHVPKTPPENLVVGFVGSMQHGPNVDAVDYFLTDIWPAIHKSVPGSEFAIWGSGISLDKEREWSQHSGVTVRGWFSSWGDIAPRMRVMASPLRYGAGMKTKVVDALLNGVPVVGSSLSFEGLNPLASTTLSAETPEEFVSKIVAILLDENQWRISIEIGSTLLGDTFRPQNEKNALNLIFDQ